MINDGSENGIIVVVWVDSSEDLYSARSIDGGISWIDILKVSGAHGETGMKEPQLVIDPDSKHLICGCIGRDISATEDSTYMYLYDTSHGITWTSPNAVGTDDQVISHPRLAAHENIIVGVWSTLAALELSSSIDGFIRYVDGGTVYLDVMQVYDGSVDPSFNTMPQVAISDVGTPYCVFRREQGVSIDL